MVLGFAPLYIMFFGVLSRPERALYAAIICFLLWPKVSWYHPYIAGISGYVMMWPETTVALWVSVFLHKNNAKGQLYPELKRCLILVAAALTVSFTTSWFLGAHRGLLSDPLELRLRIYHYVHLMQTVVFAYLFARTVYRVDQVEKIFKLFAIGGVILILESLAVSYFHMPSPGGWSLDAKSGRFQSIFYTDYDLVGFFMIVAFSCLLYFAIERRRMSIMILAIASFLPVMATFQRTSLLGLLGVSVVVFLATRRSRGKWLLTLAALGMAIYIPFSLFGDAIGRILGGEIRQDYFSGTTIRGRFALQLRGIEIGLAAFPWGVGPGMLSSQMASPTTSKSIQDYLAESSDEIVVPNYQRVAQGDYISNVHNLPLATFIENGLLGVGALAYILFVIVKLMCWIFLTPMPVSFESRRRYLMGVCSCSAVVGLCLYYLFDMEKTLLFIIMPLLHVSIMSRRQIAEQLSHDFSRSDGNLLI